MDFGSILRRAKRKFNTKDNPGKWGRCDNCDERRKIFKYIDNEQGTWTLCETCIDLFIEEEG